MDKDIRELVKVAQQQGWQDATTNGHAKLRAPDGFLVIVPKTASDHRSLLNTVAYMKRHGFKWKGR